MQFDENSYTPKRKEEYIQYIGYAFWVSLTICICFALYMVFTFGLESFVQPLMIVFWVLEAIILLASIAAFSYRLRLSRTINAISSAIAKMISVPMVVTLVFIAYIVAMAIAMYLTGGARTSFLSAVALLNATFGVSFARSTKIKILAIVLPLTFYVISLFLYVEQPIFSGSDCFYVQIFYAVMAVLAVVIAFDSSSRDEKKDRDRE